jgi:hypothetical protein
MGHEFPPDTLSAVPGEWINWCSSVTSVLERSRSNSVMPSWPGIHSLPVSSEAKKRTRGRSSR